MTARSSPPRFLMGRPEHFAVTYAINPWMDPRGWARQDRFLAAQSRREWTQLRAMLRDLGAEIELLAAVPDVPDLVFTANAAVVLDRKALLARFRHPERRREEPHIEAAFRALHAHGALDAVRKLPEDIVLEGAGDCVFDRARDLFWMGFGPRSDRSARAAVAAVFGVEVVALELADDRFYHLDTALSPLPGGEVMLVPGAFTSAGHEAIRERVGPQQLIEIAPADAMRLAANAVAIGDTVVMAEASERLRAELNERGYRVMTTSLDSFLRSGGAAFCLTLRLDLRSARRAEVVETAVA
jgi:N-dimethylarginine dimethylaminohydrolase